MIAITGAAGFIGSNLAHRLEGEGHDLVLVDRKEVAARTENLIGLRSQAVLPHDEFADALEAGRVRPDVVFHLGACSDTTETDWAFLESLNVRYSQRMWNACRALGCPLIYASSAATYGDGGGGFDDRTAPQDLRPLNLYGRSKNEFDAWALAQAAAGAAPPKWAGLKFFNVYGPRERHKGRMASVVWHARKQILETGAMRLFRSNDPTIRDGEQRRDFVYVGDCIDHMLWFWRSAIPAGLYNSGTGQARTFLDLTTAVFAALGRPPRIEFIPMPADLDRKYQNYTQADMTKLRAVGYSAAPTDLASGVAKALATAP